MGAVEPQTTSRDSDTPSSGPQALGNRTLQSGAAPRQRTVTHPLETGRALTLQSRIKPQQKEQLRAYLNSLGTDIDGSTDIDFHALTLVHFMRFVVLDDPTDVDGGTLLFESNHDGSSEEHLSELFDHGALALHRIYRHCAGYPGTGDTPDPADRAAVVRFLGEHAIRYEAFHLANHGRSAQRIRDESRARDAIQLFLNERQRAAGWAELTPDERYDAIVADIERRGLRAPLLAPAPPAPRVSTFAWVIRLALVAVPLLPFVPVALVALLLKERRDAPAPPGFPPEWVRKLAEREDFQVQNQLTHVVGVKPGLLRQVLVRGVLRAIDLLARFEYNQGNLGGITTIHFARWVLIENGRRLVFFSNYDGSWESYLGDFVDKAHTGLTSIWSNTEGFPKTLLLAFRGATDEDNFKAWTRSHQIPTPLWYSAYPELTVRNIRQNAKICAGLVKKPAGAEALSAWLSCL